MNDIHSFKNSPIFGIMFIFMEDAHMYVFMLYRRNTCGIIVI